MQFTIRKQWQVRKVDHLLTFVLPGQKQEGTAGPIRSWVHLTASPSWSTALVENTTARKLHRCSSQYPDVQHQQFLLYCSMLCREGVLCQSPDEGTIFQLTLLIQEFIQSKNHKQYTVIPDATSASTLFPNTFLSGSECVDLLKSIKVQIAVLREGVALFFFFFLVVLYGFQCKKTNKTKNLLLPGRDTVGIFPD